MFSYANPDCCGPSGYKVSHRSREDAQRHLANLRKRTRHRYRGRVYHCKFCGGWHVGRPARHGQGG